MNRWREKRLASNSSTNAAAKSPAVMRLSPAALTTVALVPSLCDRRAASRPIAATSCPRLTASRAMAPPSQPEAPMTAIFVICSQRGRRPECIAASSGT